MNSDLFYQKAKTHKKMLVDSTTLSTNNTTLVDKYIRRIYMSILSNFTLFRVNFQQWINFNVCEPLSLSQLEIHQISKKLASLEFLGLNETATEEDLKKLMAKVIDPNQKTNSTPIWTEQRKPSGPGK